MEHHATEKMHDPTVLCPHKTVNVFSDEKSPLFFFSDVPHLIKTVRNCWPNSDGHANTRRFYMCVIQ